MEPKASTPTPNPVAKTTKAEGGKAGEAITAPSAAAAIAYRNICN